MFHPVVHQQEWPTNGRTQHPTARHNVCNKHCCRLFARICNQFGTENLFGNNHTNAMTFRCMLRAAWSSINNRIICIGSTMMSEWARVNENIPGCGRWFRRGVANKGKNSCWSGTRWAILIVQFPRWGIQNVVVSPVIYGFAPVLVWFSDRQPIKMNENSKWMERQT